LIPYKINETGFPNLIGIPVFKFHLTEGISYGKIEGRRLFEKTRAI